MHLMFKSHKWSQRKGVCQEPFLRRETERGEGWGLPNYRRTGQKISNNRLLEWILIRKFMFKLLSIFTEEVRRHCVFSSAMVLTLRGSWQLMSLWTHKNNMKGLGSCLISVLFLGHESVTQQQLGEEPFCDHASRVVLGITLSSINDCEVMYCCCPHW